MRRIATGAVLLSLALWGPAAARAEMITVSTPWAAGATLPAFDPSLGTLTGVTLGLSGIADFSATLTNLTSTPQIVTIGPSASIVQLAPGGTSVTASGSSTFPEELNTSVPTPITTSFDLILSSVEVPTANLGDYEGTGVVTFGAGSETGISNDNTPNVDVSNISFNLSGTLEVTYFFTTGVPEPASLTMLGIGAAGLFGYGWRRRQAA